MDPRGLAHGFLTQGQPAVPRVDDVLISPRSPGSPTLLGFRELAVAGFTTAEFTNAFVEIDPRVDPSARLDLKDRPKAKAAVRRWLDRGDFGQLAAKLLESSSPDLRHLWLREIALPVFFEKYPAGRVACVTYDEHTNGYLALLNTLKKIQVLNSSDPNVIEKLAGRSPMSSFALNVPAELIWLMLSFVSMICFPESFAFVASCEHRYFLIFVTDTPIQIAREEEERYPPVARLVPRLYSVLDSRSESSPLRLNSKFVRPDRQYPFNRRTHTPNSVVEFIKVYVTNLGSLLRWMCEATNFALPDGQFDLDFALQTYLTIYVLLNSTYRIAIEQTDHFARKMGLFDVLELYAALVDCSRPGTAQTATWKAHLDQAFIAEVIATLRRYPPPFSDDFVAATNDLLSDNVKVVERGLIYGKNADGTVAVPNKGNVAFDSYLVSLLRALRNTKHGFAIKDEDFLAIHTGDISNDLPDYVIALWLSFVANRSAYTLKH